jgi:NAD/NADP transhydrogenase alpha subunit
MLKENSLMNLSPQTIIIDIASSKFGGNIEGSIMNKTIKLKNGVKIIGASNLPNTIPTAASMAYSNNIMSAIKYFTKISADAIVETPINNSLNNSNNVSSNNSAENNIKSAKKIEFNFDFNDELTKTIVINGYESNATILNKGNN